MTAIYVTRLFKKVPVAYLVTYESGDWQYDAEADCSVEIIYVVNDKIFIAEEEAQEYAQTLIGYTDVRIKRS